MQMISNTRYVALLMATCLLPLWTYAQPTISGEISGELGPGTYVVVGDCEVAAGASLVVQPGTTFLFSGHYRFDIYGEFRADGTAQEWIKFLRQSPTEACKHGGIRFHFCASPTSSLSYCRIDHAKNVSYPDYYGGGIYVENVGISISHCRITNGEAEYGAGIYASGADVQIDNTVFYNNVAGNGGGIYLYSCTDAWITNCIIAKNKATNT